jgi:hypothetical protein
MALLHHPAVQSVLLPVLLGLLGIALLAALPGAAGRRWATHGALLALLLCFGLLPGYAWPPTGAAQKLPWVAAAAALVATAVLAWQPNRPWLTGLLTWVAWAVAGRWLVVGALPWWGELALVLGGGLVLAVLMLLQRPAAGGDARGGLRDTRPVLDRGAWAAAALAVAAYALAGLAAFGGSLLLAQLAAMLGSVSAVSAAMLVVWRRLRPGAGLTLSPAVLMPLGLVWLVIALVLGMQLLAGGGGAVPGAPADDPYYVPAVR